MHRVGRFVLFVVHFLSNAELVISASHGTSRPDGTRVSIPSRVDTPKPVFSLPHGNGTKKQCLKFFENPGFNFQKVPWFFEAKENTDLEQPSQLLGFMGSISWSQKWECLTI